TRLPQRSCTVSFFTWWQALVYMANRDLSFVRRGRKACSPRKPIRQRCWLNLERLENRWVLTAPTARLFIGNAAAAAGGNTFWVPVYLDGVNNLSVGDVNIEYNYNLVTLVGIDDDGSHDPADTVLGDRTDAGPAGHTTHKFGTISTNPATIDGSEQVTIDSTTAFMHVAFEDSTGASNYGTGPQALFWLEFQVVGGASGSAIINLLDPPPPALSGASITT